MTRVSEGVHEILHLVLATHRGVYFSFNHFGHPDCCEPDPASAIVYENTLYILSDSVWWQFKSVGLTVFIPVPFSNSQYQPENKWRS